jgi:ADP-ribose pyrophosphatase YjhB (NUDIX family)
MGRVDYYHQPNAPAANALVVGSSAIIEDRAHRILLQKRADNGLWALPGGKMEIGETFAASLLREVKEETGFNVTVDRIVGIYSDPQHVFAYDDGEIRQQFNICCACTVESGSIEVSSESTAVEFFHVSDIEALAMHETIRIRIRDYLSGNTPVLR